MNSNLNSLTDEKLVQRFIKGQEAAFTILVQRYQTRLYKLAFMMLGNQLDAEDIRQAILFAETTIRFFANLSTRYGKWQPLDEPSWYP